MRTDERYAEAERIAVRMGFHPAFVRVAAAQGQAAELARARTRSPAPVRGTALPAQRWRPARLARLARTRWVRRSAPLGCRP